ncbi:MAG TPA: NAD(P)H-dependent oxidoreductase subunit E [Phycisphaerae bacterium]|nr:NAD(P)H-dependent oxidoreductase subunit E [Phycisphaerae bacterium]
MTDSSATPEPRTVAPPSDAEIASLLDSLGISPGSNLIGALQDIQDRFGYLPPAALGELARRLRIPLSRIWGVVSFYAQFYTEPRGRHTIRCCRGTACHVRGGKRVIQAISNMLHIEDGETTDDMLFSFETVACLGACALSPVAVIDKTYYGKVTPQRIEQVVGEIIAAHSDKGDADG